MKTPVLYIVIPCYNEEEALPITAKRMAELLDDLTEKQLIDGGVLDSFDIVSIVGALNDEFDIDIHVGNLVPENFNSIEGMMKLIEKLQQED